MSAFKPLLASDITVTPYEVNKGFSFIGSAAITGSGIDRLIGKNLSGLFSLTDPTTGQINTGSYQRLIFNSIKQLYYSNYISSSYGAPAPRVDNVDGFLISASAYAPAYDNYLQTTLTFPREFPTGSGSEIGVISIPKQLYGDTIQPGTLTLTSGAVQLYDDTQGNIRTNINSLIVGNVVYSHGLIALYIESSSFGGSVYGTAVYGTGVYGNPISYTLNDFITGSISCSFSSSYTIYETQYKCTLSENEFNLTLNPTAVSQSGTGQGFDFITGSDFTPYVTTVGLYNNNQELLAVAKLAQPVPTSRTTDMTFYVNFDIV